MMRGIRQCTSYDNDNIFCETNNALSNDSKNKCRYIRSKYKRKTRRMRRNVVIAGVKYMVRDRKSEGTKRNMSDVAECRYSRSRYIRSAL